MLDPSIPLSVRPPQFDSPQQTLATLAEQQQRAQERQITAYKLASVADEAQQQQAARSAFQQSQGDPTKAIDLLRQQGHWGAASQVEKEYETAQKSILEQEKLKYDTLASHVSRASQLLQGVSPADPTDPGAVAAANQAYKAVLPTVRQALQQGQIPYDLPDDYDPQAVEHAVAFGLKTSDFAQRRSEARAQARDSILNAKDTAEMRAAQQKLVAQDLSQLTLDHVASPEEAQQEWGATITRAAQQYGWSPTDTAQMQGAGWSPQSVAQMRTRASGKTEPDKPGTLEWEINRVAASRGISPEAVPADEVEAIRKRLREDNRQPDHFQEQQDAINQRQWSARKAAALTRRDAALRKLEHDVPGAVDFLGVTTRPPLSRDEIDKRKQDIYDQYTGEVNEADALYTGVASAAPAAPPGSLADVTRPPVPPVEAPAPSASVTPNDLGAPQSMSPAPRQAPTQSLGDARAQARQILQRKGKAADDAHVALFLKDPQNRQLLGLQ